MSRQLPLWGLVLVLLASILGVVAVKLRPLLDPQPVLIAPLGPGCDLAAGPCTSGLPGGGAVSLNVEPRGIPVVTPLHLEVLTRDLDARAVEIDFKGVDMDMGFNRPALTAAGPGRFRGEGMLPTCVRDRMTWEARVLLQTPRGLVAVPFRFETGRDR